MIGASPKIEIGDLSGKRIGIVSSQWHPEICDALVAGATRAIKEAGIESVTLRKVAGSFEIPLASQYLLDDGCDAVVTVGLVLRGETPHFDYVCQGVTQGVMDVMLSRGKPIGFGVLMCDDLDQARARSGIPGSKEDKGYDAAIAALDLLRS
ncbi:MAG: 6,7-dimethyl-8-ribityllumazine synthase [Candidatus Nanopelagicaceae bacterium]|jgi:6,7-dimethyl-8-ribityllumazine synthase